jgi:hypothetical protein
MNLKVAWLYPELMSTYGDRGNIIILSKRCEWREIDIEVVRVDDQTSIAELKTCDLVIGGGAQDRQQALVIADLRERKGKVLKEMFDQGIPGLFVCGSPQLLGHTYQMADGTVLKGLGIFDMETKHFGKDKPRCIGNLVCHLTAPAFQHLSTQTFVGFENHGGRTYLGKGVQPFAKVIKGFGNNGEDGTEGAIYKNCIATYSHGPFLSKNPHLADWLIKTALEVKYKQGVNLPELDDTYAWQAHEQIAKKS